MPRSTPRLRLPRGVAALVAAATLVAGGLAASPALAATSHVTITGRLVDVYKKTPLAGWRIDDYRIAGGVTTRSDGTFSFMTYQYGGSSEAHYLTASKGTTAIELTKVAIPSGRSVVDLGVVAAKVAPNVAGRVVNASGYGLSRATVSVLTLDGKRLYTRGLNGVSSSTPVIAYTSNSGYFTIPDVIPGTYKLAVSFWGVGDFGYQDQSAIADFYLGSHGNVGTFAQAAKIVVADSSATAPVRNLSIAMKGTGGTQATLDYDGVPPGGDSLSVYLHPVASVDDSNIGSHVSRIVVTSADTDFYVAGHVTMTALLPGRYIMSASGYSSDFSSYGTYWYTGSGGNPAGSYKNAKVITIVAGQKTLNLGSFIVKK